MVFISKETSYKRLIWTTLTHPEKKVNLLLDCSVFLTRVELKEMWSCSSLIPLDSTAYRIIIILFPPKLHRKLHKITKKKLKKTFFHFYSFLYLIFAIISICDFWKAFPHRWSNKKPQQQRKDSPLPAPMDKEVLSGICRNARSVPKLRVASESISREKRKNANIIQNVARCPPLHCWGPTHLQSISYL